MRVCYDVREEDVWMGEEDTPAKTYAIVLRCGRRILRSVSNVFTSREAASEFVGLCNRHKLDPIHLDCVIADYLYVG